MITSFETSDFEELTEAQQQWGMDYRPVEHGAFSAHLQVLQLDALQMDYESWSHAVEIAGTSPEDALAVAFQIEPGGNILTRGQEVCSASIDCYGPGAEIHSVTRQQNAMGSMVISRDLLLQGEALAGFDLTLLLAGHTVIRPEPPALHALRNWHKSLMRSTDIQAAGEITASAERWATSESIEHLVRVLTTQVNTTPTRLKRRYALARAAQEFMLDRLDEPPTLTEICADLAVSHRALHYAFLDVFGISPKAYLKAQRLYAVRKALMHRPPDTTVTCVMMEAGFFDPGHFARDYKAMFGERPSETLRIINHP
jgi:AraC family ethanolamine operon transcriptional activator